jgi:hypothetical protein
MGWLAQPLAGGPAFDFASATTKVGAPSFRAFCERVGSKNLNLPTFGSLTYESEVPTLAKDARMGHPFLW